MNRNTPRLRGIARLLPLAAILACLALLLPAAAVAEGATYTHESVAAYEKQLAAGEIASAKINKFVRHLDMTLKNGQHVLLVYPPKDEPTLLSQLQAKGITAEVLTPTVAKKEAKKPVKHKLRYIVGGILIVVVVIVGAVLVIDRRRKSLAE
jgi:hypothetical protein